MEAYCTKTDVTGNIKSSIVLKNRKTIELVADILELWEYMLQLFLSNKYYGAIVVNSPTISTTTAQWHTAKFDVATDVNTFGLPLIFLNFQSTSSLP